MSNVVQQPAKATHSAVSAASVTPSDVTTFDKTRGVYVGGSGNLAVTMADGSMVVFPLIATGVIHPLSVTQVRSTDTTATDIVIVY